MTVLVTGGAGYIGSHMVLEFLDADQQVIVLDNLSTGNDWAVAEGALLVVGESGDQATARASATTSMSAIWHARILMRSVICARARRR